MGREGVARKNKEGPVMRCHGSLFNVYGNSVYGTPAVAVSVVWKMESSILTP